MSVASGSDAEVCSIKKHFDLARFRREVVHISKLDVFVHLSV